MSPSLAPSVSRLRGSQNSRSGIQTRRRGWLLALSVRETRLVCLPPSFIFFLFFLELVKKTAVCRICTYIHRFERFGCFWLIFFFSVWSRYPYRCTIVDCRNSRRVFHSAGGGEVGILTSVDCRDSRHMFHSAGGGVGIYTGVDSTRVPLGGRRSRNSYRCRFDTCRYIYHSEERQRRL